MKGPLKMQNSAALLIRSLHTWERVAPNLSNKMQNMVYPTNKEFRKISLGNSPAQNPLFSQNINFFLLIKQNLLEILILDSAFAESWLCRRVFCFCRRTFSFSRIEFWFFRIKFCFLGTSS